MKNNVCMFCAKQYTITNPEYSLLCSNECKRDNTQFLKDLAALSNESMTPRMIEAMSRYTEQSNKPTFAKIVLLLALTALIGTCTIGVVEFVSTW